MQTIRLNAGRKNVITRALNNQKKPKLQRDHRFQKSNSVLLYPEGLITLNKSACEILDLCDGFHSILQIKDILYEKYSIIDPIQLEADIDQLLTNAYFKNWIVLE